MAGFSNQFGRIFENFNDGKYERDKNRNIIYLYVDEDINHLINDFIAFDDLTTMLIEYVNGKRSGFPDWATKYLVDNGMIFGNQEDK